VEQGPATRVGGHQAASWDVTNPMKGKLSASVLMQVTTQLELHSNRRGRLVSGMLLLMEATHWPQHWEEVVNNRGVFFQWCT